MRHIMPRMALALFVVLLCAFVVGGVDISRNWTRGDPLTELNSGAFFRQDSETRNSHTAIADDFALNRTREIKALTLYVHAWPRGVWNHPDLAEHITGVDVYLYGVTQSGPGILQRQFTDRPCTVTRLGWNPRGPWWVWEVRAEFEEHEFDVTAGWRFLVLRPVLRPDSTQQVRTLIAQERSWALPSWINMGVRANGRTTTDWACWWTPPMWQIEFTAED